MSPSEPTQLSQQSETITDNSELNTPTSMTSENILDFDAQDQPTTSPNHTEKRQERKRRRRRAKQREECALNYGFRNGHRRRRSSRGSSSLSLLAKSIAENKRVVFITGAGLSVPSGIQPFRGEDGLWSEVVWSNSTREAFRRNPLEWYNEFWLKHFPSTYQSYKPNDGHEALAQLTNLPPSTKYSPSASQRRDVSSRKPITPTEARDKVVETSNNVRIITQNVDGLHSRTKCVWDHDSKLIEAHGRVGLYKCIPEEDSDTDSDSDDDEQRLVKLGSRRKFKDVNRRYEQTPTGSPVVCKYEMRESIPEKTVEPSSVMKELTEEPMTPPALDSPGEGNDEVFSSPPNLKLSSPPLCPGCKRPCPPQSLLFDEGYHSHSHYQFLRVEEWISQAEVLVFVGTSFSVTITDVALRHAMDRGMPVYNFNLRERLPTNARLNGENIMGDATETLSALLQLCMMEVGNVGASF